MSLPEEMRHVAKRTLGVQPTKEHREQLHRMLMSTADVVEQQWKQLRDQSASIDSLKRELHALRDFRNYVEVAHEDIVPAISKLTKAIERTHESSAHGRDKALKGSLG